MMISVRKSREERRAEIAAATLKVVGEYGVQGATMSRIAEAVGISGPALYKHYAGRTEILEAALDLLQQRVGSWLDSSDHPDAVERLRELGAEHASTAAANYEGMVAPLFEFVAASPRSQLKEQMGRRQRETLQRFVDILEEGQHQGTIRGDIDKLVVAWSLLGVTWMENVAMLEGVDEFIVDGVSARMVEGILRGISTERAPAEHADAGADTAGSDVATSKAKSAGGG
jgi:AcrR family transcriptional regulator